MKYFKIAIFILKLKTKIFDFLSKSLLVISENYLQGERTQEKNSLYI